VLGGNGIGGGERREEGEGGGVLGGNGIGGGERREEGEEGGVLGGNGIGGGERNASKPICQEAAPGNGNGVH
jgi:hypothetical protein